MYLSVIACCLVTDTFNLVRHKAVLTLAQFKNKESDQILSCDRDVRISLGQTLDRPNVPEEQKRITRVVGKNSQASIL